MDLFMEIIIQIINVNFFNGILSRKNISKNPKYLDIGIGIIVDY